MKKLAALALTLSLGIVLCALLLGLALSVRAGGGVGASRNGDVNGDGMIDVSDAVYTLLYLFRNGEPPVALADSPEIIQRIEALEDADAGVALALGDVAEALREFRAMPCRERLDRFVDNGDGTVSDTTTGLMWQKAPADLNANGEIDSLDTLPWQDAFTYCNDLSFAGHDDWRLPEQRELFTIVDTKRIDPAIDPVFGIFASSVGSSRQCWTSFIDGPPDVAWYVQFYSGTSKAVPRSTSLLVRAVRDL